MDSKKEKYYRHIMRDLLSKTVMEYGDYDFTPFWIIRGNTLPLSHFYDTSNDTILKNYYGVEYIKKHYGANDEDIEYLWDWYVWNVKSTITGKYE